MSASRHLTCVNELSDVGLGREEEDDVVERDGADQVEEEPRLQVVQRDLLRLQDDLVREVVRDDSCNNKMSIVTHDDHGHPWSGL